MKQNLCLVEMIYLIFDLVFIECLWSSTFANSSSFLATCRDDEDVCVSRNNCYWIFHRRVSSIICQYFIRYIVLEKEIFSSCCINKSIWNIITYYAHQYNTYHINNNFDLSNTFIKSNTVQYVKEVYRIIHNAKNV